MSPFWSVAASTFDICCRAFAAFRYRTTKDRQRQSQAAKKASVMDDEDPQLPDMFYVRALGGATFEAPRPPIRAV